jgi:hypothetical protein
MQLPQVTVHRVTGGVPFKVMDPHIFIALALGVPQHRRFDGLDFSRRDGIDLVLATE